MRLLFTLMTAALLGHLATPVDEPKPTGLAHFRWSQLAKRQQESGDTYLSFLNVPTLSAGRYTLAKGAKDGQSPHARDEIYYVVKGRAKFTAEDQAIRVDPGTVLYVKAGVEHRFDDIEEDLELLVIFAARQPGGG